MRSTWPACADAATGSARFFGFAQITTVVSARGGFFEFEFLGVQVEQRRIGSETISGAGFDAANVAVEWRGQIRNFIAAYDK